ncbi:DUF3793 family protein [Eubacteriaceae bacterium ES2]|nr:DUF3793 family protein [Eubacteriaceae bacterium ES2]
MKNLENALVSHCAPTLAGLKTASMINIAFNCPKQLDTMLKLINISLNHKGVTLRLLRVTKNRALIYVYRQSRLIKDLNQEGVWTFLNSIGYKSPDPDACLSYLTRRINYYDGFPHEIGLFLSYPLADVKGFINNKGENCKFCGYWKVYDNEADTKALFEKYKNCTKKYSECFKNGHSLEKLTVAA